MGLVRSDTKRSPSNREAPPDKKLSGSLVKGSEKISPRELQKISPRSRIPNKTTIKEGTNEDSESEDGFVDPMREELGNAIITKFQEYLKINIDDVMQWKCPTSTAEDWDNVPEMAVQVIFYLEKHCKSIVELLKNMSANESTYSLRQELIQRFTVSHSVAIKFFSKTKANSLNFLFKQKLQYRDQIIKMQISKLN